MKWEYYDYLPVALLALAILFTAISYAQSGSMKADTGDRTLDFYIRVTNKYIHSSICFLGAFYFLTLLSVLSTIIVIYLTTVNGSAQKIFLYSVISLFCTILNFVMNLRDISTTYRECFIKFDYEILKVRDIHDHNQSERWMYEKLYEIDHETEEMLKNVIK